MKNSRGGLRDIPCRGRAGATPASARSRRGKAHGRASGTKDRPFRRTEIAAYLNPPSSDLSAEARRTTRRWLKVENRGACFVTFTFWRPGKVVCPAGFVRDSYIGLGSILSMVV